MKSALTPIESIISDLRSIHGTLRHPYEQAREPLPEVARRIRVAALVLEGAIKTLERGRLKE